MKRILSLLTAMLLTFTLLAGCGGDKKAPTDSASGDTVSADDGIFSAEDIKYVDEGGGSVYLVIRPENDTMGTTASASYVAKQMKTLLGTPIKNTSDAADGTDAYEILIGDTKRPETEKAKEYLIAATGGHRLDYIVCSIGKKIVVYGMSSDALTTAGRYFVDNFVKAEGVAGGIKYTCAAEENYTDITVNGAPLSLFKIIRPHYNSSYITQMQIEALIGTAKDTYAYELGYYEDAYVTEGDYEIIIGNANRKGVEAVSDSDEYRITVSGKRVYLNGGSIQATAMAVSEFAKMLARANLSDADSVTGSYTAAVSGYDMSKYYTYKWGDDFDGSSIDATKWYHVPEGSYSSTGMNGRLSVRSADPNRVYVNNGTFTICVGYDDTKYYGGMLMTDRTMLYKYGYLEMSAILPSGDGLWSSLWLDSRWHGYDVDQGAGYIYYQEIDVNECFGNASAVAANCHKWPTKMGEDAGYPHTSLDGTHGADKRRTAKDDGSFNNEFHTFGYLWNENECTFTCDGEVYFSYKNNETPEDLDGFHTLCYLRISAAIGFANNPLGKIIDDNDPAWQTTNKFIIDYIHIYQLDDGKQQLVLRS